VGAFHPHLAAAREKSVDFVADQGVKKTDRNRPVVKARNVGRRTPPGRAPPFARRWRMRPPSAGRGEQAMRPSIALACAGVVAATAALVASGSRPAAQAAATTRPLNPQFEQLVDRYLKEVRGVGAITAPDDLSAASFERQLAVQRMLLKDLRAIDRTTLTFDQDIDYRFLASILESNLVEDEKVQRWRQNPRVYVQFRPITYKVEVDPREPSVRAGELINDLKLLQVRIANGKKNLNQHIARWVELSNAAIDGAIAVLDNDLPTFAGRLAADQRAALLAENTKARDALRDFRSFISGELARRPAGDWKIGADVYNALHEKRYMFDDSDMHLRRIALGAEGFTRVPKYHDWGWRQFRLVEQALIDRAKLVDPSRTWLQIIREAKRVHPAPEQLVFHHLEAARKSREWVVEKDLVTIPWKDDDSIMQAADPSLWMSQWWGWGPGVPAGSKSRKSAWTIIPPNPAWSDDTIRDNLSEKDYLFMWAIATHEVYPGHHLQRLFQNENPRKLRVYESSYSNQAWCYYIEWELTPRYGFYPKELDALLQLEVLRLKLWRMGRVIIDSGLHTGRMSYDDALQLETERIGFVKQGGQINIDSITEGGSGTAAPTLGYFEWMLLREDYFKKMRELDQKGSLKDFHDRVYRIGFLPVRLVREALFHQLEEEYRRPVTTSMAGPN
jgi:uncharacterized protein (DUF885 family)